MLTDVIQINCEVCLRKKTYDPKHDFNYNVFEDGRCEKCYYSGFRTSEDYNKHLLIKQFNKNKQIQEAEEISSIITMFYNFIANIRKNNIKLEAFKNDKEKYTDYYYKKYELLQDFFKYYLNYNDIIIKYFVDKQKTKIKYLNNLHFSNEFKICNYVYYITNKRHLINEEYVDLVKKNGFLIHSMLDEINDVFKFQNNILS